MAENVEKELCEILTKQDLLLDSMLKVQSDIHQNIREKNWVDLEKNIHQSKLISDSFVELDSRRDALVEDNVELYFTESVLPVFTSVRSKLSKSKIENSALAAYVNTTKKFIQDFMDDCADSKKATTYSPYGMVKPDLQSVMVNTVF